MTTRQEALTKGAAILRAAGVADAERDARRLYRWAANIEAATLSVSLSDPAGGDELSRFDHAIEARRARKPVSQIIGERAFWGRDFIVSPDVLDPRPESETLIACALERPAERILDLGTGSGCLLLTLLSEWPDVSGVGVDISGAALDVAARNAANLELEDRVQLLRGSWFDAVQGEFDLIVANPPYLSARDMEVISPELAHEPELALSPGGDGLSAYRHIAADLILYLGPNGRALFEIGTTQSAAVSEMLRMAGMSRVMTYPDMDGRDRVVEGFNATDS